MWPNTFLFSAFVAFVSLSYADGLFTFSNYYHDHMVLQKSSTGTTIWGHSSKVGDVVHIRLNNNEVSQAVVQSNQIWEGKFTSPSDYGPYMISAVSSMGTIQISDVLFGDVWICSGQSNMEFTTDRLLNSTEEYSDSTSYQSIRFIHIQRQFSATPFPDIDSINSGWNTPNQRESNAAHAYKYTCQFQEMIFDWREKFSTASRGTTSSSFPFGFVQLAPWREGESNLGFPQIRWAQTSNVGYVPNSLLPHVFMEVAMDLPDFHSPYGSIHPRYKHEVAYRLYLGALAVAYHVNGINFEGPFPTSATTDHTHHHLTIEYDRGLHPIEVRSSQGFEVCCVNQSTNFCNAFDKHWVNVTMESYDFASVTLDVSTCSHGNHVAQVRYAWRESPCPFHQCAVYGKITNLPGPPFTFYVQ